MRSGCLFFRVICGVFEVGIASRFRILEQSNRQSFGMSDVDDFHFIDRGIDPPSDCISPENSDLENPLSLSISKLEVATLVGVCSE